VPRGAPFTTTRASGGCTTKRIVPTNEISPLASAALAALVAFAPACSSDRSFPGDFVFGTAVAGFQVDMGCPTIPAERCEDRASDWYGYITSTA
jgi:hypothetical protein